MKEHEVLDPDLEEVEPEAWSLDQVDENVEGFEGYEEVDDNDVGVDTFDSDPDFSGETDPS